jgi:glycosyltransferase involved in cell wall biosynthesis
MTAVEAQASGKPVIALGRGGVLESVPLANPVGGVFYSDPTEAALESALLRFERTEPCFRPDSIRAFAARFSTSVFDSEMQRIMAGDILSQQESLV